MDFEGLDLYRDSLYQIENKKDVIVQRVQEMALKRGWDGVIVTACQAACPTQAITFGNALDPNSKVAKLKARESEYLLLGELNTKPRTSYLPRVRNVNPELGG